MVLVGAVDYVVGLWVGSRSPLVSSIVVCLHLVMLVLYV